ncbi:hypothetical protein EV217_1933 [Phyllobacterium myrsinacearum]|nr:hypothetical protein EV217_1933 [Phyllobacterium myrsinacearum]
MAFDEHKNVEVLVSQRKVNVEASCQIFNLLIQYDLFSGFSVAPC